MKIKKLSANKLAGTSFLTAIAASLCCITPALALISGAAGAASAFSWLEPFRPYLIGITVVFLGFAWYLKLKPRKTKKTECACEENKKTSFWRTKFFLGIITVFAVFMMMFPDYAPVFYPDNKKEAIVVQQKNIQTLHLHVQGLTCSVCDDHLENAVYKVPGVINVKADFHMGAAVVKYDKSKTSAKKIIKSVNTTNYKVVRDTLVPK